MNKNESAVIGIIKAVTPKIKVEFATTAPIRLPNESSPLLLRKELIVKESSGSEVPNANNIKPIIIGAIFNI